MTMDLTIGRRVLKNGLVLATTILTCTALQANEHENQTSQNSGGPQSSERATGTSGASDKSFQRGQAEHGDKQQKFVQKALMSGQMEVQMGQLAQQKGQNEQVKQLGQRLVQDHSQANQQLQQIAQSLNVSQQGQALGQDADKHAKHQQHLSKLQGQSGSDFDKEFIRTAAKHHKKDIAEFERAQQDVQDPQLKAFIQQTLPKLRQHLQMAQAAATAVGIDVNTLAADEADDSDSAFGAPARTQTGTDRPQSSIDINRDADTSASVDVDTDKDGKLFQKGDGKVLGLPTSKTDGTYLGIIPKPGANDNDTEANVEADINRNNDASVGGAARSETGTSTDRDRDIDVDVDVDRK